MMTVHEAVTRAVRELGWNDQKVADVVGCSRAAAGDRLAGRTRWALNDAVEIARYLGVPLDGVLTLGGLELGLSAVTQ